MFKGEERIIKIPGFEIAAREWGPKDGHPIIAIHGWIDNAASFDFLAPLMPKAHIIAIDTPGCGHSSFRSEGCVPAIVDEIFYILQIASALGWEKFSVMGHSRGGALAQLVAAGSPERIESLILLDIIGFYTTPAEGALKNLRDAIQKFFGPKRPASIFENLDAATKGRMMSSTIAFESAKALTLRGTEEVEGGRKWSFDRREMNLSSVVRLSDEQLEVIVSGIEAPTCIVLARDGIIKDPQMAQIRAALISNHELHFVEGHHHVHMDNAAVVAPIVNQFLEKLGKKK